MLVCLFVIGLFVRLVGWLVRLFVCSFARCACLFVACLLVCVFACVFDCSMRLLVWLFLSVRFALCAGLFVRPFVF